MVHQKMKVVLTFFLLLCFSTTSWAADWKDEFVTHLHNGAVYVQDKQGHDLLAHRIHDSFMPASIIKLATTACALKLLGEDFRFTTDFYITPDKTLIVKGYGDPMMTSEELAAIADELQEKGVRQVSGIILDDSYFSPHIVIDGIEHSSNPYDALNDALLANFSTINIRKLRNGRIESAEPQTPLTPLALEMAKKMRVGSGRVNLAHDRLKAVRYFGELLAAFLQKENVTVSNVANNIRLGLVPDNAKLIYQHHSSQNLHDVLQGMLKFSNNFTANQIFLSLGAKVYGPPATVEKGVNVVSKFLREEVGWNHFQIAEGSGLSRRDNVTPFEMMQLVRYLEPYKELFPLKDKDQFRAKTGTLNGVNTFAGFMPVDHDGEVRFVIMINDQVPSLYKFQLAEMLQRGLNGEPLGVIKNPAPRRRSQRVRRH